MKPTGQQRLGLAALMLIDDVPQGHSVNSGSAELSAMALYGPVRALSRGRIYSITDGQSSPHSRERKVSASTKLLYESKIFCSVPAGFRRAASRRSSPCGRTIEAAKTSGVAVQSLSRTVSRSLAGTVQQQYSWPLNPRCRMRTSPSRHSHCAWKPRLQSGTFCLCVYD